MDNSDVTPRARLNRRCKRRRPALPTHNNVGKKIQEELNSAKKIVMPAFPQDNHDPGFFSSIGNEMKASSRNRYQFVRMTEEFCYALFGEKEKQEV